MINLFNWGEITLSSGQRSNFKIDCDALTDDDLATLAKLVSKSIRFSHVVGVPRGGLRFAEALKPYCITEPPKDRIVPKDRPDVWIRPPILLVDDVLTTGRSMENLRKEHKIGEHLIGLNGLVIFARGVCPEWITPIFSMQVGFGCSCGGGDD